ncbi:MAG: hypothetical protein ACI8XX_001181, partial [Polaribacter sp.]
MEMATTSSGNQTQLFGIYLPSIVAKILHQLALF